VTSEEQGRNAARGLRVLVCGGRGYPHGVVVNRVLCALSRDLGPIAVLIHGDAGKMDPAGIAPVAGADKFAGFWAEQRRIVVIPYPYPKGLGRAGGPVRNRLMLAEGKPDIVVAFPGGAGTANMVAQALEAGVPVYRVELGQTSGKLGRVAP
jgi:hypothetical protein